MSNNDNLSNESSVEIEDIVSDEKIDSLAEQLIADPSNQIETEADVEEEETFSADDIDKFLETEKETVVKKEIPVEDTKKVSSKQDKEVKTIEAEELPVEDTKTEEIQDVVSKTENGKTEDAYIVSGYKNGKTVFLVHVKNNEKDFEWTENILKAHTFIGSDLENILFSLKETYFSNDEVVNIEIRIFHWEKFNSLNKYFSDLEMKLKEIKSKMTTEEYEFLLKYKDKI